MSTFKQAPKKVLVVFAIGQLGWSLLSGIISNWLVYFYQPSDALVASGQTVFLHQGAIFMGLTIIGLITALGRVFDAVTDPFIASKSDRCRHKDGRRIPFMRAVAVPFGLITVLIFCSPVKGTSTWNGIALLVTVLAFYLCMTIYCTPYNALIPELGRTQEARINLSTYISVTYFVGTAIAYLAANIAGIFKGSSGYTNAFRLTVGILAAVAVFCMMVPVLFINEHDYADTTPSDTPAFQSLGKTFHNREFRTFVLSDVIYWIALTMFQTGLPFYITVLMKLPDGMSFVLFAVMTVLSLICYAPVNILAKRVGKKKMITFAFLFFSVAFFITSFAGRFGLAGIGWGILVAALASIPMAILGILPQAVVADIAEADAIGSGENRSGMFYAARTFAFKLGQSVAMLTFTSVAKIGSGGFGYRLSAIIAAILCFLGGLIFMRYHEHTIIEVIKKDDQKTD